MNADEAFHLSAFIRVHLRSSAPRFFRNCHVAPHVSTIAVVVVCKGAGWFAAEAPMARLDVERLLPAHARTDVTLRTPVNWTAVLFFAGLSALHLFLAGTAVYHGRWSGFLSIIFGVVF